MVIASASATRPPADVDAQVAQARAIVDNVEQVVLGHHAAVHVVTSALLAGGHVLLEDYPGLAKTLLARSFAQVAELRFSRIQFTPDLMPSDVTGSSIFDQTCSGTIGMVPSVCWRNVASDLGRRNSTERSPVATTSTSLRGTPISSGVQTCSV